MSGNEELFARFPCNGIPFGDFGIFTDTKEEKLLAYEYFTWRGAKFKPTRDMASFEVLCDVYPDESVVGINNVDSDLTSWSGHGDFWFATNFSIKDLLSAAQSSSTVEDVDTVDIL